MAPSKGDAIIGGNAGGIAGVRSRQRRHHAAAGDSVPRWSPKIWATRGTLPSRQTGICMWRSETAALVAGAPARPRLRPVGEGVVALRDTNGDGKMDVTERFGDKSSTGIALRNDYLYISTTTTIERFKMTPGQLKPAGPAEIIVEGLPVANPHQDKGIAFDGKGSLYVNVGAPSNACQGVMNTDAPGKQVFQARDRSAGIPGVDPCPLLEQHGGIWKFDENKLNQKQSDGTRYATGMRQMPAIAWHDGALYMAMNGRDQIDTLFAEKFTAQDNDTRVAEALYKVEAAGDNFGWPYCFHDYVQNKLLLNPEYGGDGKTVGRCAEFKAPIATFPPHWAPVDLMFYTGTMLPQKYRGGAFIAFHGSWNRTGSAERLRRRLPAVREQASRPASTKSSPTASRDRRRRARRTMRSIVRTASRRGPTARCTSPTA